MNAPKSFSEEIFHCPYEGCGKALNSNFSLRRHMQLVHVQAKALECRHCGKRFSLKQYLLEHEYMHTNELPFLCGVNGCTERFRQRGKLCLHRRKHSGYETRHYQYPDIEDREKKRQERKTKHKRKNKRANDAETIKSTGEEFIYKSGTIEDIFCKCEDNLTKPTAAVPEIFPQWVLHYSSPPPYI